MAARFSPIHGRASQRPLGSARSTAGPHNDRSLVSQNPTLKATRPNTVEESLGTRKTRRNFRSGGAEVKDDQAPGTGLARGNPRAEDGWDDPKPRADERIVTLAWFTRNRFFPLIKSAPENPI
jgi:hypothetical protein